MSKTEQAFRWIAIEQTVTPNGTEVSMEVRRHWDDDNYRFIYRVTKLFRGETVIDVFDEESTKVAKQFAYEKYDEHIDEALNRYLQKPS